MSNQFDRYRAEAEGLAEDATEAYQDMKKSRRPIFWGAVVFLGLCIAYGLYAFLNTADAAPKEKVLLCHYGVDVALDGDGLPIIDPVTGDVEMVVTTSIISVPVKAAQKHLSKHGDVPLVTGDAEADALALADCQANMQDADEDEVGELLIEANNNQTLQAARSTAGSANDDLNTPADTIHPNIHQNNDPGNAACPHADKDHCQNMHGIGNNPGQSGNKPNDDGVNGFANQLENVHGGIGSKNPNARQ